MCEPQNGHFTGKELSSIVQAKTVKGPGLTSASTRTVSLTSVYRKEHGSQSKWIKTGSTTMPSVSLSTITSHNHLYTDTLVSLLDYSGKVVSQEEPFLEKSIYWGYNVRVADSLESVFDECPYEGGYDFKLGTSDKGNIIDFEDFKQWSDFKHGMIFFGGLEGIEGLVELDETSDLRP